MAEKKNSETPVKTKANDDKIKGAVPTEIDASQYVTVRNGFHGTLTYVSPKTGETFNWSEFGAEQEMELRELRNAKSASKAFFINNWFMFDDEWVIDYLGVRQFYKNIPDIDHYDEIFDGTPDKIKKKIAAMSDGQKRNVIYRAHELIENGTIDSRKMISALEEALGVDLVEK